MLSHYTSRAGLEGILDTETLWATNFLELNDSSEFFFAWEALQRHAAAYLKARIPDDLKQGGNANDATLACVMAEVRTAFASSAPNSGHLYVTSFARAGNEDQERRGILTLWDRYTKFEGYCLQFLKRDIEHKLKLELTRGSYSSAGLAEVTYGLDETTSEFRILSRQLGEHWLLLAARIIRDSRISPDYRNHWPESFLVRNIMEFCARHKDPCFEDEREIRVFLYPADRAEARVFTGIAGVKKIRTTPSGKRFLAVGEFWRPGIIPSRIIVGPKADPGIEGLLAKFNLPPVIAPSNLPIA